MKRYKSPVKNWGYLFYRVISEICDPIFAMNGVYGYFWFLRDLINYKLFDGSEKVRLSDLYPRLHDKTGETHVDYHYYYQQLWLFEKVLRQKPKKHVDFGSTYQMSGYLSKIMPTTFVDCRPIKVSVENLSIKKDDLLNLSLKSESCESISCLHVIEHVGLGRYGDCLDLLGSKKAAMELVRVLKKQGRLYVSVPIGKPRLCFNAHRIFSPGQVIKMFKPLKLITFSVVDDGGIFVENVKPVKYDKLNYGCGMFEFEKL